MNTVTQEGMVKSQPNVSVSVTTGHGINGALLNVSRHYKINGKFKIHRLDANGRTFASREEAFKFALERGYLRPYRKRRR